MTACKKVTLHNFAALQYIVFGTGIMQNNFKLSTEGHV